MPIRQADSSRPAASMPWATTAGMLLRLWTSARTSPSVSRPQSGQGRRTRRRGETLRSPTLRGFEANPGDLFSTG